MTESRVEQVPFDFNSVRTWGEASPQHRNWPVVYILNNERDVYVGESLNAESRLRQHLGSQNGDLDSARVLVNERFNKSVCLDLESYLIRMFAGDGRLNVRNRNVGITNSEYFDRPNYRREFDAVFERLRTEEQLFSRTVPEIINSDLFKLSPFKALNHDQAIAVEDIVEGFFADMARDTESVAVVQGNPGTGKTVVAIYLLKLLEDIRGFRPDDVRDEDSIFDEFFTKDNATALQDAHIGIVVPQQSLRSSVQRVFSRVPGMQNVKVLTPFNVGESATKFDLLVVDEAHRLNQRANQPSGPLNKKFEDINLKLFGVDNPSWTQLDWIRHQAKHVVLMIDGGQSVRPADLPESTNRELVDESRSTGRLYPLLSQMRIAAQEDYVGYTRSIISDEPPKEVQKFDEYDLRLFTDFAEMRAELSKREAEFGLARLVAGFAWEWRSKGDSSKFDIQIDDIELRWNSTISDWINSPKSSEEVGSIHTVQGYDLNYAGVIIGRDLRFDPELERVVFDRSNYKDKKGRENNPRRGITYSDEDLLRFVRNIYTVLLTRGIRGTYAYVCDEALRTHLEKYLPVHRSRS